MNKQEFLAGLKAKLSGLPASEVEERLDFYSEMIDDRVEDGLSEEEAICEIGSVESVASQILADIPLSKIAKEKLKQGRKLKVWEIVLLALGSPIWLSLLIAVFAVVISLYAVVWSVVVSLWAVFGALVGCGIGGLLGGIALASGGNLPVGIALVGAAAVCSGVSIFFFFGCDAATKGTVSLTKIIILGIKKLFVGKGNANE